MIEHNTTSRSGISAGDEYPGQGGHGVGPQGLTRARVDGFGSSLGQHGGPQMEIPLSGVDYSPGSVGTRIPEPTEWPGTSSGAIPALLQDDAMGHLGAWSGSDTAPGGASTPDPLSAGLGDDSQGSVHERVPESEHLPSVPQGVPSQRRGAAGVDTPPLAQRQAPAVSSSQLHGQHSRNFGQLSRNSGQHSRNTASQVRMVTDMHSIADASAQYSVEDTATRFRRLRQLQSS